MPKQNNNNSIARQWELLRLIPSRKPGITSAELTKQIADKGYIVTKRTVERDLRDLSAMFPLLADEESVPFRWYWLKDISSEFGGIEVSDAVSLTLAEDVLKSILPVSMLETLKSKFELARKKLATLEDLPISKWSSKVAYISDSLAYQPIATRTDILEDIQSALVDGLQIEIKYDPVNKPTTKYILNPLGFVQRGVRSYLVATKDKETTPILFAIQRFRSVEILESKIQKPKDFTLKKYIESGAMDFGDGGMIKLKAIVSDTLATYLNEAAISPDQKISYKNNAWQLTATVRNSWQLWFWIRSQGSDITILQPKSLRNEIVESLKLSLKNYE